MMGYLSSKFSTMPTYLGVNNLDIVTEGGKQFVRMGSELKEVVYATSGELLKLPYEGLVEGYYLVGTGNTGVAAGLTTMGLIYAMTVFGSSLAIRRPAGPEDARGGGRGLDLDCGAPGPDHVPAPGGAEDGLASEDAAAGAPPGRRVHRAGLW